MSPSSRQKKRGTRSGQTTDHKQPQVVHGQPGASTGQHQLTNKADQAPQEHAARSTGEHPGRSGRGAGHERVQKELARALKKFVKRAGHQAELEPRVGERDARRADLRVCIKGKEQFINIRVIKLFDERDRSRQDPTGQGFPSAYPNASAEEALDRIRATLDERLIEVENELRQQYSDVKNFSPIVLFDKGYEGPEAHRQWRYWGRHLRPMGPLFQEWCHILLNSRFSTQEF